MVDLMNKQKVRIWGREFELEIIYDCYEGEQILPAQEEAVTRIFKIDNLFDSVKRDVETYCLAGNAEDIGSNCIENIFKYVMPKSLYIKRPRDDSRTVALMCAYKFNPDDGLAVVFKNEQLYQIGSSNIIL